MNIPLLSPAKINLFLRVLRKRDDGYHDIVSLMQPVSLYDELWLDIENGSGISVSCDEKSVPTDETNLAFRAASAFLNRTGIKKKVIITIKKKIPVAAGLGGGSSNAATVLKGLNGALNTRLSEEEMMKIGTPIGSDVPFFIACRASIATGRGEVLEPVEIPKFWHILVNPHFPVSTQWAYANLNLTKKTENINISVSKILNLCKSGGLKEPDKLKDVLVNDLEPVSIEKHPEIEEIKKSLINAGASGALMSGSGPTVFGLFYDEQKAKDALGIVKKSAKKDWAVYLVQGL